MASITMSEEARQAQRRYMNVERWENKARKIYGDAYQPAKNGEIISAQALELRRAYSREYRRKHPDLFRVADCNYWERKAKKGTTNT